MKTLSAVCLLLALGGCANKPHHQESQSMQQWVDAQNAKPDPCKKVLPDTDWISSGSNGRDFWTVSCREGKTFYEDTTEENYKAIAEWNKEKDELIRAARSRLLSEKEMTELLDYGPGIFTRPMVPYQKEQVETEYDELLLQQARLRKLNKP